MYRRKKEKGRKRKRGEGEEYEKYIKGRKIRMEEGIDKNEKKVNQRRIKNESAKLKSCDCTAVGQTK